MNQIDQMKKILNETLKNSNLKELSSVKIEELSAQLTRIKNDFLVEYGILQKSLQAGLAIKLKEEQAERMKNPEFRKKCQNVGIGMNPLKKEVNYD